jgi:hypothetical protein
LGNRKTALAIPEKIINASIYEVSLRGLGLVVILFGELAAEGEEWF